MNDPNRKESSYSEKPNNSDLIYRQDALEALRTCYETERIDYTNGNEYINYDQAVHEVEQAPSAQPEIIRCTECKHYREYDSEYVENAVVVQCMADRYPISETIPDGWFCAGAERKDDE